MESWSRSGYSVHTVRSLKSFEEGPCAPTLSLLSLPDASNNNTVSNLLLRHFWSTLPVLITIMKWLSWWQLSHIINWNYQGPNRRNMPPMPYSKFWFLFEVGSVICIRNLFSTITSKCYWDFSWFASLRLLSTGRVLTVSCFTWEIISETLHWLRSSACLSSAGEPVVFL